MNRNITNYVVASVAVLVSLITVVFAATQSDWRLQFAGADYGYYSYGAPTVIASDGEFVDKVEVSWNPVWGAQYYQLFRCESESISSCNDLLITADITTYIDTEAIPGVLHYYRVEVVYLGDYSSDFSEPASGYRSLLPPASISASDGLYLDRVQVSWSMSSGATSYSVNRCSSLDLNSCVEIGTTINQSFQDGSVPNGELSYYRIRPASDAGSGVLSDFDSGYRSLSPPDPIAASDGEYLGEIRVSWGSVPGATQYGISRCVDEAIDTCVSIGSTVGAFFGDSGVAPGAIHYYRVTSFGDAGSEGVSSAPDSGYRAINLDGIVPDDVLASNDKKDMVTVGWSEVDGAAYYDIYRSETGDFGTAVVVGRENSPSSSHDDVTAVPEVLYFYWVKALNPASSSDFSSGVTGRRVTNLLDGSPPLNVLASDGEFPDKINISWVAVAGATKYEIYRSRSSDIGSAEKLPDVIDAPAVSYDDFSVESGDAFYYWVKAINIASESLFSAPDRGFVEGGCDYFVVPIEDVGASVFCL